MKYFFLPAAEADLDRLYDFLAPKNPDAAERAMATIRQGMKSIRQDTVIGVRLNDPSGHRDLIVRFGKGAYILRYRIEGDTVFVTRIWHSREDRGEA